MRYLMSTSIIPAGWRGPVEVEPISLQGAKRILKAEFTSAVGHAATAELLTGLFGLEVTHNRVSVSVRPGDEFVAFQLLRRPPEGAEERAECLQVLAGAIESLAYKGYHIIDQDETPDECALVESLKDEAQAILDAPRCDCGAEPCEFENCDSQAEGWICHSCCAEAYGACGVKCPECGERVVPTLPVDYADRRLRSSCGPETTGHCGACGARWD